MTPIKDPTESVIVEFDFTGEMSDITSAEVSISIHGTGMDADMASMLVGALQIIPPKVLQRVALGVPGVNYKLRCKASHGSDVRVRSDVMPVRTA